MENNFEVTFKREFNRLINVYPDTYPQPRLELFYKWMKNISEIERKLPDAVDYFILAKRKGPLKRHFCTYFETWDWKRNIR